MTERRPRWDIDERRIGVGHARAFQPTVDDLARFVDEDGWVAEEPEAHLLPHLERAAADTKRLKIVATSTDDAGRFLVDFAWTGSGDPDPREVRIAMYGLVGTIAEEITTIREPDRVRGAELEMLTGMSGTGASPFATHGHTLRLRIVEPASVRSLLESG